MLICLTFWLSMVWHTLCVISALPKTVWISCRHRNPVYGSYFFFPAFLPSLLFFVQTENVKKAFNPAIKILYHFISRNLAVSKYSKNSLLTVRSFNFEHFFLPLGAILSTRFQKFWYSLFFSVFLFSFFTYF